MLSLKYLTNRQKLTGELIGVQNIKVLLVYYNY